MPICPKCGTPQAKVGAPCTNAICIPDGMHTIYDDELGKAESDPRIGQVAAEKYVITGRISKGGMGAVYRAMQLPVEREVAFKVLRTELEDSSQGRDRFIQEAKAISKLQHANIIVLYDFGFEPSGHPYMVMEYAPGKSLADWLVNEQLTTERILHVLQQLLSALEEAHQQNIIHRDLKPDNMIIVNKGGSQQDVVKLLDFGIARIITESSTRGLTREGEIFGTPHYMAPEQAQGFKKIDAAADVYAVGIILYEMLCGEAPFDAESPLAVLLKHISEPLPALHPRPGVVITPELEAFVQKATAKEPKARFADAGQMLIALYQLTGRGAYSTGAFSSLNAPAYGADLSHSGPQQLPINRDTLPDPPAALRHTPPPQQPTWPDASDASLDQLQTIEHQAQRKKLGLVLAALVVSCLIFGGAIAGALNLKKNNPSDADPIANLPTPTQTTEQAPPIKDAQPPANALVASPDQGAPPEVKADMGVALAAPDLGAPPSTEDPKETTKNKTPRKIVKAKTEPKEDPPKTEPKVEPKEEPKKFEPKKFGVKEPKEEPKKFEPKKFGVKEPSEQPKKVEPKKFQMN